MSLFVSQGLPVYVIYLYHSLSLSITNSHLRHLCSKVAIHYNIVSGLHASLLVVCKRYRLLPTGCLYLGWGRECSAPSLLNLIRLARSLPQFDVAKEQTFEKLQKRDNLVTLLLSHAVCYATTVHRAVEAIWPHRICD